MVTIIFKFFLTQLFTRTLVRAVIVSSIIGFACVFVSIYSAEVAFVWFLSITAVSGFISWAGISGVHIRFRRAYVRQGRSVDELPYKAMGYPYSGIFATVLCIVIILGQGYTAFTPKFNGVTFVMNYIGILPFLVCYIGHKLITRKKLVPLEEVGMYYATCRSLKTNFLYHRF